MRFPPPLVFLGLAIAGWQVQRWIWPFPYPIALGLRICGALVALGGALLLLSARSWFERTGQHPAPWLPSPELLVQGIYARTRNPMYLGLALFQFGLGIALGNIWIAGFAPLALLGVHFIAVRPEEAYLTERFGQSYVRYMTTVRRYL